MSNRIRAYFTKQIAPDVAKLPDSIEWMPAGKHVICCSRNGEPAEIEVQVDESIVAVLNEQLQAARALADSGKASRPYIDFDHASGEAAAIPREFFWQDGIRLRVEWTTAGAAAVSGRVYSYFSPEFFTDKARNVTAIPSVGPIGSLVNTPAFQAIERIAASLTAQNNMIEIAKALGLPETATEAEILAKIAELLGTASTVAAATAEASTLKAALAEKEAAMMALIRASAKAEVERHAASAEIPDAIRPILVDSIVKNAEEGRKILAAFKPAPKAPGKPPFKAEHNNPPLFGMARALAAAKK
ncbi:MAG: phage protease [Sulfuricella sp.]